MTGANMDRQRRPRLPGDFASSIRARWRPIPSLSPSRAKRVDGNDYAPGDQGGCGVRRFDREPSRELIRQADDHGNAIFTADDATGSLRLAQGYRALFHAVPCGITGSIGKTTTKDVLCALLATRYRKSMPRAATTTALSACPSHHPCRFAQHPNHGAREWAWTR